MASAIAARRRSSTKNVAILSIEQYVLQHEQRQRMLRRYLAGARGRRLDDAAEIAERMADRSATSQFATSGQSRIAYAKAAKLTLEAFLAARKRSQKGDVYFFTVTPEILAEPLVVAAAFDHRAAISWMENQIGSDDYFGVLEAAYFSNFAKVDARRGATVSWHFISCSGMYRKK